MSEINAEDYAQESVSLQDSDPEDHRHGSPPLSHNDYTVAWVCALPEEQTAATAMLQRTHPSLPRPPRDKNTYTLGSIWRHNIVIICLQKGKHANISSATAAVWMAGTFPCLRSWLLVGVGGGIPPKVRLGDVVVSTPAAEHPGVIQWDIGKGEKGGRFRRTGALNNPPTALLTAVAKLETRHAMHGPKITQYIDEMGRRYPRLLSQYTWSSARWDPGAGYDQGSWRRQLVTLWATIWTLIIRLLGWSVLQGTASSKRTGQRDTNADHQTPREVGVHYGLIASGSQLIKDAEFRDRLNKSLGGNILCLEMEAAGLMNDFPCIVIRGIGNYADSNKNDDWRGYAAAVAAGFAKELLEVMDHVSIKHMPDTRIIKQKLERITSITQEIVQRQTHQIYTERQRRLYAWLSLLRPSVRHIESQKQRVEGTGDWFLQDPKLLDWSSTSAMYSVLCCYGDPGTGRTILASLVIDKLREVQVEGQALAYLYCDYRDQDCQTTEHVLGTFLQQLLMRLPDIPEAVWRKYRERAGQQLCLSSFDAKDLFHFVGKKFKTIYVCIDAFDEFRDQRGLLELLRYRPSNMKLFLTCRPHLQNVVQKYLGDVQQVSVSAPQNDVQKVVEYEIGGPNDLEPDAIDDNLRMTIIKEITETAKGAFLLPLLQVRSVLQNLTISSRERALQTDTSYLEEAFAGSFERIQQQPVALSSRAAHILAWTHLAGQPLTVDELLCSLAIKESDTTLHLKEIPVRETLLNCCHGLVVIDQQTSTIRLVHYKLQDYLQRQRKIFDVSQQKWQGRIASTCLNFLRMPALMIPGNEVEGIQDAFLMYAATQWGHHLRKSEGTRTDVLKLAIDYLDSGWKNNSKSLSLLYSRMYPLSSRHPPCVLPIHIGAYFGVEQIVYIYSEELDINLKDVSGRTPLSWSSGEGHETIVRRLIEDGATIDVTDKWNRTPLSWASENGHEAVVRLLLGKRCCSRPD